MQIRDLDQAATGPLAPATPRRQRRRVLLGAGALALVLATIGTVAALGSRPSPAAQAHEPSVAVASPNGVAVAPRSPKGQVAPNSTTSAPASAVLADGTYPTYIDKVDIDGATITVDVIQVFENGEAAINAAVEDGMARSEAQYLYVYIRNLNPRLRTLPVARAVSIQFADGCEAPPVRHKALTELAERTATFDDLYFYEVTVVNGAIDQITQRLARAAC